MKYFGGCDVGSTYTKCVILDENGKIAATVTNRSKINPVQSAQIRRCPSLQEHPHDRRRIRRRS